MAKLPSSFRTTNRTTASFRSKYAELPPQIKDAVRQACVLFDRDPAHRSLRRHALEDLKKGRHLPSSFSVSITMQYRALYVVVDGINVWYWIGTHADYKKYTGSKK